MLTPRAHKMCSSMSAAHTHMVMLQLVANLRRLESVHQTDTLQCRVSISRNSKQHLQTWIEPHAACMLLFPACCLYNMYMYTTNIEETLQLPPGKKNRKRKGEEWGREKETEKNPDQPITAAIIPHLHGRKLPSLPSSRVPGHTLICRSLSRGHFSLPTVWGDKEHALSLQKP